MKRPIKVVYYYCSYCKTRKASADPLGRCENCGAYMTEVVAKEINLGKQPFHTDQRRADPQ